MPDDGGEGQDALPDTDYDSGGGASAVLFEVELAFEGVVDRFDDLACTVIAMIGRVNTAPLTYFTDAERAALALTEAATPLADRTDPVSDEVWDEATRHYESQLAGLVVAITAINAWNRINVTTRQISGEWVNQWISPKQAG